VLVAPEVDVVPTGGFGLTAHLPHELSALDRKPLDDALALAAEADVDARRSCWAAIRSTRSSPLPIRSRRI
jgi:hypothetical protein